MIIRVAFDENAKRAKASWTITEICSNPESPQEQQRNYLARGDLMRASPHGPMMWKVMQRNGWSDIASWLTKTIQQRNKVATPCRDDHQFKEEELGCVGELSKVCSQIVLKCLYLARIGRPDIPWSVNKLARAVAIWTQNDYIQYCHVGKYSTTLSIGIVSRF